MKNKVYFLGAGPGDPGLITVKGLEVLRQADVVIYDYLVDKRILESVKEDTELICCNEITRNRHLNGSLIYDESISQLVIEKVEEGKRVVRLKNGDPCIFGRISQELELLVKNNIEFEIVPGVTSASAAGCLSGIPLTDRRFASSCVFVTGHEDPIKNESLLDWDSLSKNGTLILYMPVKNLPNIVETLIKAGKSIDTPVAVVQDVSLITQKVLIGTLEDIVDKVHMYKVRPPAIVIIGEVVNLEEKFNWLKKTKKILFTGLSKERFFIEGFYFHLPLIKIEPLEDYTEFDSLLRDIDTYDWIVFSSRYGVQYFFERLYKLGFDTRWLRGVSIAAIGNSTKSRLLDFGVIADLVPQMESSRGLLSEFEKINIEGKRIFLPRSNLSDKGLTIGLENQKANVVSSLAYRNVMQDDLPDLDFELFDEIIFTSPSVVRNFVKKYGRPPKGIKINCIGDVTLNEAKKWNLLD